MLEMLLEHHAHYKSEQKTQPERMAAKRKRMAAEQDQCAAERAKRAK